MQYTSASTSSASTLIFIIDSMIELKLGRSSTSRFQHDPSKDAVIVRQKDLC